MIKRRHLLMAGVSVIVAAGLSACGATGDGHTSSKRTATVSGLRDDVRHIARKTESAQRAHMVNKCTTAPKRVKHTSTSGSGNRKRTRTWTTTENSTTCRKVKDGTERYTRVVRPERWCVELDDVNGDRHEDDTWYQVTAGTYATALAKHEGDPMKITPSGYGCAI